MRCTGSASSSHICEHAQCVYVQMLDAYSLTYVSLCTHVNGAYGLFIYNIMGHAIYGYILCIIII